MEPLQLLLWSIILYVAGGILSLILKKQEGLAIFITGISAMIGGVLGILSALPVIFNGETASFAIAGPFDFAAFVVRMDMLGAFMVFVISLLVTVCALYSFSYVQEYKGRGAWSMGFFMNLFIASMVGLIDHSSN
ncbi:hypothetical protein [Pseudomonas aeruginosa]|uniref:hypothetical protein n=1 Tax=Pseudomonas aeruginosa TaxID=287 RepID=UPI001C7D9537|nr:hypothetical protein [Pseudomonas aeruginosa]